MCLTYKNRCFHWLRNQYFGGSCHDDCRIQKAVYDITTRFPCIDLRMVVISIFLIDRSPKSLVVLFRNTGILEGLDVCIAE